MFAVFSLSVCIYGRHGRERSSKWARVIWFKEKSVVCPSLELQKMERALTDDVNDLCVTAECGHILIVHGLMSYRTPLGYRLLLYSMS